MAGGKPKPISLSELRERLKAGTLGQPRALAERLEEARKQLLEEAKAGLAQVKIDLEKSHAKADGPCEQCSKEPAYVIVAETKYGWDGEGENPNRDLELCAECATEYRDHWSAQWEEYMSSRL